DADLVRGFVQRLSPETRYLRFMSGVRELSGETLDRLTRIDYERDMALIAVMNEGGVERLVGVVRYAGHPDGESCEFAIVVADDWKGRRLGRHLITLLVEVARARGYKRMDGDVLPVNRRMLEFARSLGFELTMPTNGAPVVRATLRVSVGEHAASHLGPIAIWLAHGGNDRAA